MAEAALSGIKMKELICGLNQTMSSGNKSICKHALHYMGEEKSALDGGAFVATHVIALKVNYHGAPYFDRIDVKRDGVENIFYLCREHCMPVYHRKVSLALEEARFKLGFENAKAMKLIADHLERENVKRAMEALETEFRHDKKEEQKSD